MSIKGRILFPTKRHLFKAATGLCLFSCLLLGSAAAQSTPGATQQGSSQDCEKIKQDIEQLQQELADISLEMQRLTAQLDRLNNSIAESQAKWKSFSAYANETARGEHLDVLAKAFNFRKQLKQQLEDDATMMQDIKNEIADLLNKLANCAPPSTTQPPKATPSPQPPPPSNVTPPSPPVSPGPPSPQTPAPGQHAADQDCEKIKQDIEELQQELADISLEMQRLTAQLDGLNNSIAESQAKWKSFSAYANETARGEHLDVLAKVFNFRKQLKQQLEDDATMMQDIKNEIADLLNKLANCGPPSATQPPNPPSPPQENKKVSFDFRGFGGPTFANGNTPATAGFDGAVLFPLGNHVVVGPTAGFQWINSSIVSSIGSMMPGSTFVDTSAGFKSGNFGGRIGFPFGGWQLGVQGGATVAGSSITQQSGFCGLGNATSPAGCTVLSSTTTHDTVTGPFVGGYISHSIFSHVGVFVGYDYHFGLKDTKPNPTNPSGPSITVFDLHYSDVVAGFTFTFGRH